MDKVKIVVKLANPEQIDTYRCVNNIEHPRTLMSLVAVYSACGVNTAHTLGEGG
jgi:hypothetical protein